MYKYIFLGLSFFLFIGCHSVASKVDSNDKIVYQTHSAQAYSIMNNTKENEINSIIQKILPVFDTRFKDKIEELAVDSNHQISNDAKNLLKKNMLLKLTNESKNQIREKVDAKLANIYSNLEPHTDLNDNQIYKSQITEAVEEYFQNEFTSSNIESIMEKNADNIESDMLNTDNSSAQNNLMLQGTSSSLSYSVLDNAQKTQEFNNYMTSLFGQKYTPEGYTTNGGSIDGGSLHGSVRIMNSLSDDGNLVINEPSYENGKLKITTTEKNFNEYFGTNNKKIRFATSADINGSGEDVLVVVLCDPNSNRNTSNFYKIGGKEQYYNWERIFQRDDIDCHHITDMVAGDFDGDGKDEIAISSSSDGVYIYDDETSNFTIINKFDTDEKKSRSYRLAAGNVANKSYEDLAVLVQNHSNSTSKAYLFELSGIVYDSNNSVKNDHTLYTLNEQEFSNVVQGDVIISDLESAGRLKMYVLEMTTEEEKKKFQYDDWKENHKGTFAFDNDWCTYRGYYKNHFKLWSADRYIPSASKSSGFSEVGNITVTNRISKSLVSGSCKDSSKIDLTNSSKGRYGYLFSKNKKIEAIGYKQNDSNKSSKVSIIDLNGLPIKYEFFRDKLNYEVSDQLYKLSYYSANSKNSKKPNIDDNHYKYEDLSISDYNYVNSYIQAPKNNHKSYYHHNSKTANVSKKYGNRNSNAVTRSVTTNKNGKNIVSDGSSYANESLVLRYKRHQTLYTDPQVLVYLSAPPVKAGQSTTFEFHTQKCKSKGTEDSKSNGFTGGLSVQFGAAVDIPLVSQDDILVGVSTEFDWSKDISHYTSNSKCIDATSTTTSDYTDKTNLKSSDHVLLKSEIIDSYVYEVIKDLNNPSNKGKELTINVTRKRKNGKKDSYQIWKTVDGYYEILKNNNRKPYVDFKSIITHKPGYFNTYLDFDAYTSYATDKKNSNDENISYFDFYETDSYQIQEDGININSVEYSISSTIGTTITESKSLAVSIVSEVEASGGAVIQAKSVTDIEAGWTHSDTIAVNTETSDSKSYCFSAKVETTDENSSETYSYGVFTYYVASLNDDKNVTKGHPIQIIDFYRE